MLGIIIEKLGVIRHRCENASSKGFMLRWFVFIHKDGTTCVTCHKHIKRIQYYFNYVSEDSPLSLLEDHVKLVYDKLIDLQRLMTTEHQSSTRPVKIPPTMGHTHSRCKDPSVLFSRGSMDWHNKSKPREAYFNQALYIENTAATYVP